MITNCPGSTTTQNTLCSWGWSLRLRTYKSLHLMTVMFALVFTTLDSLFIQTEVRIIYETRQCHRNMASGTKLFTLSFSSAELSISSTCCRLSLINSSCSRSSSVNSVSCSPFNNACSNSNCTEVEGYRMKMEMGVFPFERSEEFTAGVYLT